jgi:hypothetical protein
VQIYAFWANDGRWNGIDHFVAVTALMMTAYSSCHCGERNPAALTRRVTRSFVRALPRRRTSSETTARPKTGPRAQGARQASSFWRTRRVRLADPPVIE